MTDNHKEEKGHCRWWSPRRRVESGLCGFCDRDDGVLYVDVAIERDDRATAQRDC